MLSKHQCSLAYRLLHQYSKCLVFHWYSNVEIVGQEHIPYGKPCIIQANHQNALMDCVTLLGFFRQPILFFARSDMFSKPLQMKILHFLKILPAYRHQEGWENVKKNEENFHVAQQWLQQGLPLCIMPEGGQDEKHRLRSFVKGPFRIALATQHDIGQAEQVFMLPIGIGHGDYNKAGYPLLINIGKPIDVQTYLDEYQKNNALAINHLKTDVHQALQPLMLDIASQEHYEDFYTIACLCDVLLMKKRQWRHTQLNQLKARQSIIDTLQQMEKEEQLSSELLQASQKLRISHKNVLLLAKSLQSDNEKWTNVLFVMCTLPLYIVGGVVNFPIWLLMFWIDKKMGKSGFAATINYVIWIILSPIFQLLASIIIGICLQSWLVFIVLIVAMPILSLFCVKYYTRLQLLGYQLGCRKQKSIALLIQNIVSQMNI